MNRVSLLALVLLSLPATALCQSPNAKTEALLRRETRERRIPGLQAAVVKNGRIVLLTSVGTVARTTANVPHYPYATQTKTESLQTDPFSRQPE
jgi:hypothetical protein